MKEYYTMVEYYKITHERCRSKAPSKAIGKEIDSKVYASVVLYTLYRLDLLTDEEWGRLGDDLERYFNPAPVPGSV